jgi:hypothetical protein
MGSLSAWRFLPAFRSPWVARGSTVPDGQLHPLRSVPPPANPFTSGGANPTSTAVALLGFFPSRDPVRTSEPRPARTRRSALPSRAPRAEARSTRDQRP